MKVTTAITLFKSKILQDGTHPLMVRMYINKKRSYYATGISCMEDEWNSNEERLIGSRFKNDNLELERVKVKVDDILRYCRMNGQQITKDLFEEKFLGKQKVVGDVFELYEEIIQEMDGANRLGNKAAYKQSKTSIQKFWGKKDLLFSQVNPTFLNKYESYHLGNGCTKGGIAVYLRSFRSLCNIAVQRGLATQEMYPFKNQFNSNGYSMAKLKTGYNPKAMSEEDLERFKNFDASELPRLEETFKTALFIYYARGINYSDLAYLRWKDIQGGRINYVRKKTGKSYSVRVTDTLQDLLDYFGETDSEYVFPILNDFHKEEKQKRYRVIKKRTQFNKRLKEIGELSGVTVDLSSYVLRHTYATTLKRKGAPIAKISEAMGHQNTETTNHYLKSFGDNEVDALDELL